MRKLINGKIIDIADMGLFEMAAEGMSIGRKIDNIILDDKLDVNFDEAEDYISAYKGFYDSLPFPLYGIDSDLKYCCAGIYITKSTAKNINIWVDNGLYVCMNEDKSIALKFVNRTWGFVNYSNKPKRDLNISKYSDCTGFNQFVWTLSTILNKDSTTSYYELFMPNFVSACNGQAMIMKWELGNMLCFGNIPNKIEFKQNKIEDIDRSIEYNLDIFTAGSRKINGKQRVWSFNSESAENDEVQNKTIKVYGYDLYKKINSETIKPEADKIKKVELCGVNSLFCTACYIKNINEYNEFPNFYGIITNGYLIFSIDGRVFIAKENEYTEAHEIARGVNLYSYDSGLLYLVKSKLVANGVRKDAIYSYSLSDENTRICRIDFVQA